MNDDEIAKIALDGAILAAFGTKIDCSIVDKVIVRARIQYRTLLPNLLSTLPM
jgi:hypothetical protein